MLSDLDKCMSLKLDLLLTESISARGYLVTITDTDIKYKRCVQRSKLMLNMFTYSMHCTDEITQF